MINLIVDFSSEDSKVRLYSILKKLKPVKYILDVKQFREKRSINQNKYYWGVVIGILSQETGFFPDEMHDVLKRKFNPISKVLKQTGEECLIGGSTTEMDTADFEIYMERIRTWALTELDCLIPLPNE